MSAASARRHPIQNQTHSLEEAFAGYAAFGPSVSFSVASHSFRTNGRVGTEGAVQKMAALSCFRAKGSHGRRGSRNTPYSVRTSKTNTEKWGADRGLILSMELRHPVRELSSSLSRSYYKTEK